MLYSNDEIKMIDDELEKIMTRKMVDGDLLRRDDCIDELQTTLGSPYDDGALWIDFWMFYLKISDVIESKKNKFEKMWKYFEKHYGVQLDYGYQMACRGICTLSDGENNRQIIENLLRDMTQNHNKKI